jgi:ADP-heptose:LPS heptosyltransferase
VRIDCRHFTGSVPCAPHKHDRRPCETCGAYEPTSTRILIVKLAASGDVLRTTCVLPALRAQYPQAQITWITERVSAPLLEANPFIDRVVARDDALERLMIERFDIVFGLDPDEPGAAMASIATATARVGFVLDAAGRVLPANDSARHWWAMGIDDNRKRANRRTYPELLYEACGLSGPVALPQLLIPSDALCRMRTVFAPKLEPFERVIVLNTGGGARWAQKKWTPPHYAEFINRIRDAHRDWAVLVVGGPAEASFNAWLLATARGEGVIDGGSDRSLRDFGAVLSLGDIVVTSDSLALHMATALGVSAVVLVGPTSPWELELYGRGEVVHAGVPCLACYRRRCPLAITCMDLLKPDQVVEAVERQLSTANFTSADYTTSTPHRQLTTGNR